MIGLAGLAQFILHTTWVLYTTFKFGWGPGENGWSLFAVGRRCRRSCRACCSSRLLKRFSPQRLARARPGVRRRWPIAPGASATEGWMMYAVIAANVLGFTVAASMQSIVSNAADAPHAGPDDGRRRLAEQPDGGGRAGDRRAAARRRVAPAARRLAHRRAVLLLRRAAGRRRCCLALRPLHARRRARRLACKPAPRP